VVSHVVTFRNSRLIKSISELRLNPIGPTEIASGLFLQLLHDWRIRIRTRHRRMHRKDHFENDIRSDQDHLLKKDLRSDQDQIKKQYLDL
jgi:hypothetical protein